MIYSMSEMQVGKLFSGHAHLKISWIHHQIYQKDVYSYTPPFSPSPPDFHKESSPSRISPAVLFIIVILAILFFVSGLLHLLVRFLTKTSPQSRSNRNIENSTSDALQRQLQQLFNLHDSGLDQAFIDALPLFTYKEIVGPKEPFDCAVCLCEFTESDQLRLLPTCSHAFHINCIDTWLLSNSSCPLCRGALCNPGFPIENPIFDYDDFREDEIFQGKRSEIEVVSNEIGGFPVRLGKFRKSSENELENELEVEGETSHSTTSSSKLDARRCYSMGSYQYVVNGFNLRVALSRDRVTNCGSNLDEIEKIDDFSGKKLRIGTKTDSYSTSKIWLWSKKGQLASSSDGTQLENPASYHMDLPWMNRAQNGV